MNTDNAYRYPLDVRFFEVDAFGVVFNMWYLGWCDEAMNAFMESIGYGYTALGAQGFVGVLRKAELEWLDSLEAFQHAEIAVRVEHVGTTSYRLRFDIERVAPGSQAGRRRSLCAQVAITYVCVQIDQRRNAPIPVGLREALVKDHSDHS
jgi:acyl-CoA thioester hydrolase